MRLLPVLLAILAAFLLQTLGAGYVFLGKSYFDLFLLTAAVFGLIQGRLVGMATGTAAGLVQDAFSAGMLGLNGLSKTTVGYLAGIVGNRLIIRGWMARFLFFAVASAADLLILAVVGGAADRPAVLGEGPTPLYVCAGNGLLGAFLLSGLDWLKRRG